VSRVTEIDPDAGVAPEGNVKAWVIERFVLDCGLSILAAKKLHRANADWHQVFTAVDAGQSEEQVLNIFT